MKFRIGQDDFKLYAEAEDVEANIIEIDSYFKTKIDAQKMNDRINFIKPFAIGFINSILDKGVKVPIPSNFTQYIRDPKVQTFNRYLFIDAEPYFGSRTVPDNLLVMAGPVVQEMLKKKLSANLL